MTKKNWLVSLGLVIYILLSAFDKFVLPIPNYLYITIAAAGIVLIVLGFIMAQKNKQNQ